MDGFGLRGLGGSARSSPRWPPGRGLARGHAAGCSRWHWPTHGERQRGWWVLGGGGEIPRKEQTCVGEREKSWGAMGRPGTRHPKFPREPSWGSALSPSVSRHRAPATLLTQGIRLCLSFPSLHGGEGGEQCVPPSLGTPGSWPALWSRGHRDSARGWHTWPGVAPGAPPRWHRDPLPSLSPHGVMGASSCLRPPVVRPFPPPPPNLCWRGSPFPPHFAFFRGFLVLFFFFFSENPQKSPKPGLGASKGWQEPREGEGGGQGGVGSPPACGAQNWGVLGNTWPRHMPMCCHVAPGHDAAVGKLRHEARLGCSCGRACSCAWMSWGGHMRVWLAGVGMQGQGTRVRGARLA